MKLLEGKVALITGAARGIGNAIAHKFAAEGADIAFTDLALNEEHLANINRAAEEIAAHGVKCIGYASNAADFAETEAVVAKIKADFGRIDILVNNAGITKDGLMLRMSEAQWDAVINVNLKSAFNFIHRPSTSFTLVAPSCFARREVRSSTCRPSLVFTAMLVSAITRLRRQV